jgi:hypothetical protein
MYGEGKVLKKRLPIGPLLFDQQHRVAQQERQTPEALRDAQCLR